MAIENFTEKLTSEILPDMERLKSDLQWSRKEYKQKESELAMKKRILEGIELRLKDHVGNIKWIGHEPIIPPAGTLDAEFFLNVPVKEIPDQKNKWKMEC